MSSPSEVDVLVVGAGPTGLTLGAMLAKMGVSLRIVDKLEIASDKSRALVVHIKSMELLQKLGVADELVEMGRKTLGATIYVNHEKALEADLGDIGIDDTPFSYVLFASQAETERALAMALERAGGKIERGIEVTRLDADANGVTAILADSQKNEQKIRARYVVGCDGAHSVVRHASDFKFEGDRYLQDFVLADAYLDLPGEPRLHLCFNDDGLVAIFPFKEKNHYRILAMRPDAPENDKSEPTLEEVQKLLERFSPFTTKLYDPHWLARFRLHHRQADRYRDNRYFLAGDSAHIHSPAGGQGMNTGIQDAANLAWKLALVLKHGARESLLDTYDEERHPVGEQLLRTTDRMFSMNTTRMPAVVLLRNFVVRRIAPLFLKAKSRVRGGFRFLSELDIAYPKSSIVVEHGSGLSNEIRAGNRAPDAPLGSSSIFERTATLAHHLLVFEDEDTNEAEAFSARVHERHPFLKPIAIPKAADVARKRYGIDSRGIVIVRPDGYAGLRSARFDEKQIAEYARRIFG
ncbi:MAG: FAD-dependent monooxygenase [Polyangiaceae bacterium]